MRSDTITMEQEIRDLEAELAVVRAERDALAADFKWLESAVLTDTWQVSASRWDAVRRLYRKIVILAVRDDHVIHADTLREAIAAARKQQEGATQ